MLPKTFCQSAFDFALVIITCTTIQLNVQATNLFILNETEPSLHIDFDGCLSFFDGSHANYSEFTAISVTNPDCGTMELEGGSLYRSNPEVNSHSCAPGFEDTSMCIDGLNNCTYVPGHDKSLKFDVKIVPGPSGFASLKEISFYEQAPVNFSFLEGSTGLNNYPTLLGIRVLVNGVEIFRQEALPTPRTWQKRTVDFSIINGFRVSETTVFNIELLPYCLIGNGANVKAWDIDELSIVGGCNDINGGVITVDESATICNGDSTTTERSFSVLFESGANLKWLLTDAAGIILAIQDTSLINFDTLSNGIYNVYHLSYESGLSGLTIGENISSLSGCFDLSNMVSINNSKVIAGELSVSGSNNISICLEDSLSNELVFALENATGLETTYIVSDLSGNIVLVSDVPVINFINVLEGQYNVSAYSHNGDLFNAISGMNVSGLSGCFAESNSVVVTKQLVEGGEISIDGLDEIMACPSNGELLSPLLVGATGENMSWILHTSGGLIIQVIDTLPLDISIMNFESVLISHISYLDNITGLQAGEPLKDISGCFDLSNTLTVLLPDVNGGMIDINGSNNLSICLSDNDNVFNVTQNGAEGEFQVLVVTDTSGMIISLPQGLEVDFSNAGAGECLIWYLSYEAGLIGLEEGMDIDNLEGCYSFSNSISVIRDEPVGGELSNNLNASTIETCSGDNVSDEIIFSSSNFTGNFTNLVVTDNNGVILEIPDSDTLDFEGVIAGTCLVYNLVTFDPNLIIQQGLNIDSLVGCYDLSNAITIVRNEVNGGDLTTVDSLTSIDIIIGDNVEELIDVILSGTIGDSSVWVITDTLGVILDLPQGPPFSFENAGQGVCQIWHLSYLESITGLQVGLNINDLIGCHDFSNAITVNRTLLEGGEISFLNGILEVDICVGDPIIDSLDVIITNNEGPNSSWIITDTFGVILELPTVPPFVFENAGQGVCQIWHLSYANTITGLEIGENISGLSGSFSLSNNLIVNRTAVFGGVVTGPFGLSTLNLCSGDGIADEISVTLSGNIGDSTQWVITNESNVVIDLPLSPPFDFEGAPAGTCFIYNLSYNTGLTGLGVDISLDSLQGCYDLSNVITIIRDAIDGGIISTDSGLDTLNITVGDSVIDSINVTLIDAIGDSTDWVITDTLGVILDITTGSPFIFEGAGSGTCLIYHLSSYSNLIDFSIGNNISDILGCHDFSNAITVIRTGVNGGVINTPDSLTTISICIPEQNDAFVDVVLNGNEGTDFAWIITDDSGLILELPTLPPFNFGAAPSGVCQIWHIGYVGIISGLEIGQNISGISGSYDLSNAIIVTRSAVDGGLLLTTSGQDTVNIIANDGISDAFDVNLTGAVGDSLNWIITDNNGIILGFPLAPPFDLDTAGVGVCQIWNIAHDNSIMGLDLNSNISALTGCFDLSNPITVIREAIDGGDLSTLDGLTEVTVCFSDTLSNVIDVMLTDTSGTNSAWIISDTSGLILALPMQPPFDFTTAGIGICQIWHLSYDNGLTGLEVQNNLSDLMGAFDLSNNITVTRDSLSGGMMTLANGELSDTITVGDGIIDSIDVILVDVFADTSIFVITDTLGIILDLVTTPPFTFENAGGGVCQIWHLAFSSDLSGLSIGNNLSDLSGCLSLSNAVTIVRQGLMGGTITTTTGLINVDLCLGDEISDSIDVVLVDAVGPLFSWIISDTSGIILALPSDPPFDFSNSGSGICEIWNLTHDANLMGLELGLSIDSLVGNFDFSNPIIVNRTEAEGGVLMTSDSLTSVTIVVGDGLTDTINVILNDAVAENLSWVITDPFGTITELPSAPPFLFPGPDGGLCDIWNISYPDGLTGLEIGMNINALTGCFDFSNPISVNKIPTVLVGGNLTTDDFQTVVDLCVGDGTNNPIDVLLSGSAGPNQQWVLTDTSGLILGLPSSPPFDLELAGAGSCQIMNIAYANGLQGLTFNENIQDLVGFYNLSNPITVNRTSVNGGNIVTTTGLTTVNIVVGDGITDSIDVVLTLAEGDSLTWLLTDTLGVILSFTDVPPFTFETEGGGVCQIINLSYSNVLTGLQVGNNISQLSGCFEMSNIITVNREGVNGGILTDLNGNTTTRVCLGGNSIDSLDVILTDTSGTFFKWIIADSADKIIGLQDATPFIFNGGSPDSCRIYNIAYDMIPGNLVIGDTISNLTGIFDLSNVLNVTKEDVFGGSIEYPDMTLIDSIEVGDGIIDSIFVNLSNPIGDITQWVVTDTLGNILGLPTAPPFIFESAGGGVCQIWNLSYLTGLQGLVLGNNVSQLVGCYDFSNPVTLVREGLSGGFVTFLDGTTSKEICVGDGIADFIDININGAQGMIQTKLATRTDGQIIILNAIWPFNFELPQNIDTFILYNMSYDVVPSNLNQGTFISALIGDFALSNGVILDRNIVKGGSVVDDNGLASSTIIVGDGILDTLNLNLTGAQGDSLIWVVTNNANIITSFTTQTTYAFPNNALPGVNKYYHAAFVPETMSGLEVGMSIDSISGCFDLSNQYILTRKVLNGGILTTTSGDTLVMGCTGANLNVVVNLLRSGELGNVFNLVVTNTQGTITDIPTSSQIIFDQPGTSLIYNISHDGSLTGLQLGQNIADLGGCFLLSNSVTVERTNVFQSTLSFSGAVGDSLMVCVGDQMNDIVNWQVDFASINFVYILTDTLNVIDTILSAGTFNFEDSDVGECRIYGLSYGGDLLAMIGDTLGVSVAATICDVQSTNFLRVIKDNCTSAKNFTYKLFPNPAVETLTLDLRERPYDVSNIDIYNSAGKIIKTMDVDISNNHIDISSFDPGVYYMKIRSKGLSEIQKFIVID